MRGKDPETASIGRPRRQGGQNGWFPPLKNGDRFRSRFAISQPRRPLIQLTVPKHRAGETAGHRRQFCSCAFGAPLY
jgi:hypothetical protein